LKNVHRLLKIMLVSLAGVIVLYPGEWIQGANFSVNGYIKNFFVVYHHPDWGALLRKTAPDFLGAVNQRIRSRFLYQPTTWLVAEMEYDLSFRIQDSLLYTNIFQSSLIDPLRYRYKDFHHQWYPTRSKDQASFSVFQNLDRLVLTLRGSFSDLVVGRQTIAWGSARAINPCDVIAPFTFDELDKEERIGVDALRWRIPIGLLSEFDAGYIVGKAAKSENNAFFTRLKLYQLQSDVSFLLVGFRQNVLIGLDFARSIGGAGTWFETAYVYTDKLKPENRDSEQDYFRASLGCDYSFSGESYVFLEYHFNGAGQNQAKHYLQNLSRIAYQEGSVYLLGKHYLIPGCSYQFTPLINGLFESLINLTDPSLYLTISGEYNVAQNIYLVLGSFIGVGKSFRNFSYQSEFGVYPDIYYTSFRVYF